MERIINLETYVKENDARYNAMNGKAEEFNKLLTMLKNEN